jgi:hypothetical protein
VNTHILRLSDDFWNIRGSFKLGGLIDIGTHASLVRLTSGKFVLLDACDLPEPVMGELKARTRNGADLEAIIHVHPFHTMHVQKAHEAFPEARLYGTRRHHERFPQFDWQPELTESEAFASLYAEDFDFSVPEGVDFISSNENLHFASVLVYHRASRSIHVDDTLMVMPMPGPLSRVLPTRVSFHMTLAGTLEKRAGASEDFRAWARTLADRWQDAKHLCAAHSGCLMIEPDAPESIRDHILKALKKTEITLKIHKARYG